MNNASQAALQAEIERLRERLSRLETVVEVSREISSQMVLEELLIQVMDQVTRAMQADRSSLFLYDRDKHELWSQVAQGEREIRFSADLGLAGYALRTGETLNIPDAYQDARFNQEIDRKTGYRTRSVLVMPIRRRDGETIGVIQVINRLDGAPFSSEDETLLSALTAQISIAIDNARLYTELKEFFVSFIESLADTIDRRHELTAGHTARVRDYSLAIGRMMGLDGQQLELLNYSALLHDYGKIAISDAVLKKPGRLTDAEYAEMRTHTNHTRNLLAKIRLRGRFQEIAEIACHHHEKMDGTGYPDGLRGDAIHPLSRIMAVADVFDALTSVRDYRTGMPVDKAIAILEEGKGTHFDPECVDAFVRWAKETGLADRLDARNAVGRYAKPPDNESQPGVAG